MADTWVPRIWGAVGVLIVVAVGYVAYLHWWPVTPITIKSLHVDSPQVAGKTLTYTIQACKHVNYPSTVYKEMVGVGDQAGNTISFPPTHGLAPTGCHVTHVTVPLPANVTPGRYYLRDDAQYDKYPLRSTVNVYSQSNIFTVVGS